MDRTDCGLRIADRGCWRQVQIEIVSETERKIIYDDFVVCEFSSGQRSVAVARRGANDASFITSEVVETGAGGTRALGHD